MKVKNAITNDAISYTKFSNSLEDACIGDWDSVNSTEIIQEYITAMMISGVRVSHILIALEQEDSKFDMWKIWLGNSMNTPSPINSKQDLVDALSLSDDDLNMDLKFK